MKKIAIISPMILPVPAVNGGAVEMLITDIINQNESENEFLIDIYSIYNREFINTNYKNTKIVSFKTYYLKKVLTKIINKIFGPNKFLSFKYKKIKHEYQKNKYDITIIENNVQLFKYLYNNNSEFYFHLHNDLVHRDKTINDYIEIEKKCKKIIVVSNFLKNKLLSIKKTNKIHVLENCIDINKLLSANINDKQKKKSEKIVVGYVGRVAEEKGLYELIKAFNLAKNNDLKLLLVCDNFLKSHKFNSYNNLLKKEIKSNNENIEITGYINNLNIKKIYGEIDILVIPTKVEEAFGIVALEGLLFGKKIVATNSGELPNLLKNTNSIIIDKKDIINNLCIYFKNINRDELKNNIDYSCYIKNNYNSKNYFKNFCKIMEVNNEENSD